MADEQQREPPSLELPAMFKRRSTPEREPDSAPEPGEQDERPARRISLPAVRPLPAALVTGAFVGLVSAGLVWLALRGCAGLRGTSSCGDPGLLVLLAIFVAAVLLGRWLLGALRVPQAGSTSLLAVALVAVLVMLVPDALTSLTGAVVMAVLGAAAFAAAQWLTSSNTSPGDRPR